MASALRVSEVRIRLAAGGKEGLLGWASCIVGGAVALHNIVIRQLSDGTLALGFPARFSHSGAKHYYFNPISDEARRALEDAILARLKS